MTAIDWTAAELPSVVERLPNALTVIVHAERKCPLAAVYLGYRAGSREEPASRAGLAHLCEHLMYTGTSRNPGSYFAPFEQLGASSMNAFVKEDYSAYFATVPASALDFAMSMEADRMANITQVLDRERIERQRDVVINELRQREGQPYGCAPRMLAELVHRPEHPYAHPPDGLEAELREIPGDDVRAWLELRHSPAAATLIVAGDVEPARVIESAKRHFGPIPSQTIHPGNLFAVSDPPVGARRQIELAVEHARLCIGWIGPGFASPEYAALEALCEILAAAQSSRLSQRLVQAERLATEVTIELRPRELGTLIVLSITAQIGVSLGEIEAIVREEIEHLAGGPESQELETARLRLFGKMVRGFEHVGGPCSKSDRLGLATMVCGTPDSHGIYLRRMAALQPDAIACASQYLASGGAVLEMHR